MKPKNLQFPFCWEERAPLLADNVLYVPKYYDDHALWSKQELNDKLSSFSTIALEYCSGNGTWIAQRASLEPGVLWIAVEKRFDRVRRIWAKQHNLNLQNLLIVCGEALVFTQHYLPPSVVDRIFVNFPDPWPKAKHAKNRLLQGVFIKEMDRVMRKEGTVTLVTDDEVYSGQMLEQMEMGGFRSLLPPPYYETDWQDYGSSFFDELWRKLGKTIRYMQFTR